MAGQRLSKRLTARTVETLTTPGRHADGDGLYLTVRPGGSKQWIFLYRSERSPARDGVGISGLGRDARQGPAVGRGSARADEQRPGSPWRLGGETEQQGREIPKFGDYALALGGSDRGRLFECQAPPAMAQHPDDLLSADLDDADRPGRHEGRPRLPDADLDVEAGDGQPGARTDRAGAERREGRKAPLGREPRGLARPPRCDLATTQRSLARTSRGASLLSSCPHSWTSFASGRRVAARALEFVILTATRTSEALNATWDEFDLEAEVWTIPAARMKARVEHRVPLSRRALEILRELKSATPRSMRDDYVFAGQREGTPLSNMALLMMLRRMKREDITAHGFRSTLQRLGERGQLVQRRTPRDGARAHDPKQGRTRLPSRRCPGKAEGNDGGLGDLL